MSQLPEKPSRSLWADVHQLLFSKPEEPISAAELARLRQEIDESVAKFQLPESLRNEILAQLEAKASAPPPTPREHEVWAILIAYDEFANKIANRQATKPLDFDAFHRSRNEFDRKVLEGLDDAI